MRVLNLVLTVLFVLRPDLRPFEIHAGLCGLALNAIVVVVGSLASGSSRHAASDEFVRVADGR